MEPAREASLHAALAGVHGHEPAVLALEQFRASLDSTHAFRRALDRLHADDMALRSLAWPTVMTVREMLHETDALLDRTLLASIDRAPLDALATDLAACGDDVVRAHRSLAIAWTHLSPPSGRASATLIDLLRARSLGPTRVAVYQYLVRHGCDVRGPLADDSVLDPDARIAILSTFAARVADAGRMRPVLWQPDPLRALARALADWPMHATHPRHLLFAFARREPRGVRALDEIARWSLPVEVRACLAAQHTDAGEPLVARSVGGGRWECGRCGDTGLTARGRRSLRPDDPLHGGEVDFACGACGLRYSLRWEFDRLGRIHAPADDRAPVADPGWANAIGREA